MPVRSQLAQLQQPLKHTGRPPAQDPAHCEACVQLGAFGHRSSLASSGSPALDAAADMSSCAGDVLAGALGPELAA
ncbi:MAG TPA: hypothetical protein VFT22_20980 [Kofleriaceae bacterium]|nr:hypothetical protein [Kofleriaceae bacterium]